MKLKVIDTVFSVCKVEDYSKVDLDAPFCFIGKTDEENSLVCRTEDVPDNTTDRDDGWKVFARRRSGLIRTRCGGSQTHATNATFRTSRKILSGNLFFFCYPQEWTKEVEDCCGMGGEKGL